MNVTKPNFYILGAAKSGTTALWDYLNSHPDIFMSNPKEPNFMVFENKQLPPFSGPCNDDYLLKNIYNNSIVKLQDYEDLFESVTMESAIGEASVRYLYFEDAVKNIKKYTPNAKFVLILRHPVDRLYSHYCMMRRYGLEPLSLEKALEEEDNRIAKSWGWDWHYKSVSKYGEQLEKYFKIFDRAHFKIILYEDFKSDLEGCLKEIYTFLKVKDDFISNFKRSKNVGFLPKNYAVHAWLKKEKNRTFLKKVLPGKLYYKSVQIVESINQRPISKLNNNVKDDLTEYFKKDIQKLESLLEINTNWYT